MTPEERVKGFTMFEFHERPEVQRLIAAAIAEEREACAKAVCQYCAKGAPFSDPDECMTMGHFHHGDACHPFSWDDKGRVNGHIGCAAAAIRART